MSVGFPGIPPVRAAIKALGEERAQRRRRLQQLEEVRDDMVAELEAEAEREFGGAAA